jgi:hypothetical protein
MARCFAERAYPEREVGERLAVYHEDVAALRRYLVDAGLMTRDRGEYRRAQGLRLDGRFRAQRSGLGSPGFVGWPVELSGP